MTVRVSVIIPSVGRDTLGAAVDSCAGADEVIVVENDYGDHGYRARTEGIARATGTHLAFMDDDDVYLPGAIETFRRYAADVPVIFRMDHYRHGILWRAPMLRFGNVSTQMLLVPNKPDKLGVWEAHMPGLPEPGGDFTFLTGCVERMGAPIWRDEIVARLRPTFTSISIVTPWLDHPELWDDYKAAISVCSPRDEMIIVDNGSNPPALFATISLPVNRGFSGGSNRGLHAATGDAVLFLNNDIVAFDRGWLEAIRNAVEPGVLVGANLRHQPHGDVDGHALPYLDGWCLAGMRDDLLDLGGFDETYQEPAYFSDNDLCLRARAGGMSLREVRVGLHHKTNVTAGGSKVPAVRQAFAVNRERFAASARELLAPVT